MRAGCVYSIDITTNDKNIISVSSDNFDHFYIANINDNADEIAYEKKGDATLYANFFMLRIINDKTAETLSIIERLSKRRDIIKVKMHFTNGNSQEFEIAKKRIVSNKFLENKFEDTFFIQDDLCIIISEKKLKYKQGLFS